MFIGDNICTDIFGANLYNKYLQDRVRDSAQAAVQVLYNMDFIYWSVDSSSIRGGDSVIWVDGKYCFFSQLGILFYKS